MDESPGRRSMWKVPNVNNVNLEIRDWWTGIRMVIGNKQSKLNLSVIK